MENGCRILLLRPECTPIRVRGLVVECMSITMTVPRPGSSLEVLNVLNERPGIVAFTSPRSLPYLVEDAKGHGKLGELLERLSRVPLAAVGPQTSRSIRDLGLEPALVPPRFDTLSLAHAIKDYYGEHRLKGPVLHPASAQSLPHLEEVLGRDGIGYRRVVVYEHVERPGSLERVSEALESKGYQWIVLTSPLIARLFLERMGKVPGHVSLAVLGPSTLNVAETLAPYARKLIAPQATLGSLLEELRKQCTRGDNRERAS